MTCARCQEELPTEPSGRRKRIYRRCTSCRRNYHHECFKLHKKEHRADPRRNWNFRKFTV